jgi:hypothetical protein
LVDLARTLDILLKKTPLTKDDLVISSVLSPGVTHPLSLSFRIHGL